MKDIIRGEKNDLGREKKVETEGWEIKTLYTIFWKNSFVAYSVFCIQTVTALQFVLAK